MESRVIKGKKLLNWTKSHSSTIRIFSDEKLLTVDQARKTRKDRFLVFCVQEVPLIAYNGKRMSPH
ncbi:Uncharacterized protein FKW44_011998 [Caligus rogercresseyi]|uniref:Uncharacterized protein n=1 Tax=Caligus rogercresseyi TaxID=217165 RepID=A0A7T8HJ49_CALRO|nr:Uncharacterized protein FKW44_011998 [Caligus rogercresseyi]